MFVRQAQWRFSRHLPRALASGARGLQPGVTARSSSARVGVGKRRGGAWRRREARRGRSPAPWRCGPRRVSAWAKARWPAGPMPGLVAMCSRRMSAWAKTRRPAALSALGVLGRYWAAQWHLARAVGKRFRGCRAKRLYFYLSSVNKGFTRLGGEVILPLVVAEEKWPYWSSSSSVGIAAPLAVGYQTWPLSFSILAARLR